MGRLRSCEAFHNDEAGHENFRHFLRQYKNIPVYLIVDAVEEDYRLETLPHAIGQARRGLVERRLGQLYRNAKYRAASLIGREKDKRRDDIYLFQALNNADSLNLWVLAIEELHAPLAGIYLLPMVSQALVNRLKLVAPDLLLTDWQGTGLRQTYFQQGRLRVSRLAPAADPNQERLAELYEVETEKTRLYLLSQRLIARDTILNLLVLAPRQQGEVVCRRMGVDPNIECKALDSVELAQRLGLEPQQLRAFPELLYMQVLAKGGVSVNLASQEQTRSHWIQRLSGILWLSAAAMLLGGFLVAALNVFNTMDYKAQTETARTQTRLQEDMYNEVARNFPSTPLNGENLRIAVEMSDTIAANAKTPLRLMQAVSASLDNAPEILLQRLRWKLTTDINSKDDAVQSQAQAAQGVSESGTLYETGFLDGEIRNFQGDYRAALNSVNRLADLMRKDPRVGQVQVVQQPVNVSSQTSLQGSTLDAAAQQMPAAQFKLKVILKPEVTQP